MSTHREKKKERTVAEIVVDPKTGKYVLQGRGETVVEAGKWSKTTDGQRVIRVPLDYDASVYFEKLVDCRQSDARAAKLRFALELIASALEGGSPETALEVAKDALEDPFELAAMKETEEREEEDERRRAARRAEVGGE